MDQGKDIDLTARDYKVKQGKRREPIFNWPYVWPFLLFVAVIALSKYLWLVFMGRL